MAEREYRRLTRAAPRMALGIITVGRSSLWLGKDHVLCIDTNGYTESYKRFFLRDIQALVLRRTARGMVTALVLGGIVAICAALMVVGLATREPVLAWVTGCIAAFWLLLLGLELWRGPTCVCHVRTAVQTEELPSLGRVRRAHKVLARLRPLIAEAQGVLAPEEIPARWQEWANLNTPVQVTPVGACAFVVDDPNAPPRIV